MDAATHHSLLQLLGDAMSDISEDCYYAGWLGDSESLIPELCRRAVETGTIQRFGHGEVTPEKALALMYLADLLGCWANLDPVGDGYVPHQAFPITPELVADLDFEQSFRSAATP